jgi:hypothetical protein
MVDLGNRLHLETKAAEVLRKSLDDIAGDDLDLIRDTMEGETSLRELISKTAESIVFDGGLVKGIGETLKALQERKDRIEKRIAIKRVASLAAMQIAEIHTLETPAGTLTRKAVPSSVLVLDEAAVPAIYWKPQDPKIDKTAIKDAIKAGEIVPGCQMSNGGETLQIRS